MSWLALRRLCIPKLARLNSLRFTEDHSLGIKFGRGGALERLRIPADRIFLLINNAELLQPGFFVIQLDCHRAFLGLDRSLAIFHISVPFLAPFGKSLSSHSADLGHRALTCGPIKARKWPRLLLFLSFLQDSNRT